MDEKVLKEINRRIKDASISMQLYSPKEDKYSEEMYHRYLYIWGELFSLRKALFSQEEIDAAADAVASKKVVE